MIVGIIKMKALSGSDCRDGIQTLIVGIRFNL